MADIDAPVKLEQRTVVGKGINHLRRDGVVPAVIHNHGQESIHVMAPETELKKVYLAAGKHHPLNLEVGTDKYLALIKDAHFDPVKRRLADPEGAVVPISSAEFRLLVAFLSHPRQVLDRDRLLDMVQGREAHLFDRAVDNQVSRLRRKMEDDSRDPRLIQTVWGGGYRLAADVRRLPPERD